MIPSNFKDIFHLSEYVTQHQPQIKYNSKFTNIATVKSVRICADSNEVYLHLNNGVDFLLKSHSHGFTVLDRLKTKSDQEFNLPDVLLSDFSYKFQDKSMFGYILTRYYELKLVTILKRLTIFPPSTNKHIFISSNNPMVEQCDLFQRLSMSDIDIVAMDYSTLLRKYKKIDVLTEYSKLENTVSKILYSIANHGTERTTTSCKEYNYNIQLLN